MFNISTRVIFILGFISGILLSFLYQNSEWVHERNITKKFNYPLCLKEKLCTRTKIPFDISRYSSQEFVLESDVLFESISILCLVLVEKDKNFKAIENTWGKGCNAIKFLNVTSKVKPRIIPVRKKEIDTWIMLCKAIKKIPIVYNWILIIEDDTFVIMENLRYYVMLRNASENFYIGQPVKFWNTIYNIGTAGYILSQGALNTMKNSACITSISLRNREDFMLGHQLASLNITATEALDEEGLPTFHTHNLNIMIGDQKNGSNDKKKCFSKHTVTFNAIEGDKMYTYYYLLYSLQLFYDGFLGNRQPKRKQDEEVWQSFLREHKLPLDISNEKYYEAWDKLIDSPHSFGRHMRREDYEDT